MKYKFGDKVRVRRDLRISTNYGDYMFVSGMDDYKGNVVTISEVYQTYYCIEEDIGTWIWTDEMFDGLVGEELTAEEAIKKVKAADNNPGEFIDVLLKDGKWTGKVC